MGRSHLRYTVRDKAGSVIQDAAVYVYSMGTTDPPSGLVYTTRLGATEVTWPLISDSFGEVEAWFAVTQSVEIKVTDNTNTAHYPGSSMTLNFTDQTESAEIQPAPEDFTPTPGPGTTGHEIQEDGTPLTSRTAINFVTGIVAVDNAGADSSDVSLDFGEIGDITSIGTKAAGASSEVADAAHVHDLVLNTTQHGTLAGGDHSGDLTGNARVGVRKNSAGSTYKRRRLNLVEGTNVTLTVADDSGDEEVDITIAADSPQGDPGATGQGFTWLGEWSPATEYDAYDVVYYEGNAYVALDTATNQVPPEPAVAPSAHWDVFTLAGETGAAGLDGTDGAVGPIGPQGASGPSAEELLTDTTVTGSLLMDYAEASVYDLTLTGNTTIELTDSLGLPTAAMTALIREGGAGEYVIDWTDVPTGRWFTATGEAPDTSAMATGEAILVSLLKIGSEWFGTVAGAGISIVPPADTYPTLDLEELLSIGDSTNKYADGSGNLSYSLGAAVQVGDKIGGIASVILTREPAADLSEGTPAVPVLTGGGASAWTLLSSTPFDVGGSLQRRLCLFACRDIVSGAAAGFTVTITGGDPLAYYTSCMVRCLRTTGAVPPTWLALMVSSVAIANDTSTAVAATLGAAGDPTNRPVMVVAENKTSTLTPEAGWTEIGNFLGQSGPVLRCWFVWKSAAPFDTSPTATLDISGAWGVVTAEMKQG